MPLMLTGAGAAGALGFTPASLSGLAVTLLPAQQRSAGLLWQNTAKTVAATADGDPVRVAVCPYTALEFTAPSDTARPLLWDEGGGKWSLAFDGVDDYLVAAHAAALDLTPSMTIGARLLMSAPVAGDHGIATKDPSAGGGGYGIRYQSASALLRLVRNATTSGVFSGTTLPTGSWRTGLAWYDSGANSESAQVVGGAAGTAAAAGATTTNTDAVWVGRWRTAGGYWPGRMAGVVLAASTSAADRAYLTSFLNAL
jgi:hypothetical protein